MALWLTDMVPAADSYGPGGRETGRCAEAIPQSAVRVADY
jgi:hypothetical protein